MDRDEEARSWPMVGIEHPLFNDVVYGRGGLANNHKGNKRFRKIVSQFKDQYATCSRHEKTAMAELLVKQWRAQSPPGRFVKKDEGTGLWYDVGSKARSKCSQLLREGPLKTPPGQSDDEDSLDEELAGTPTQPVSDNSIHIPPPPMDPPNISPLQVRPAKELTPTSPSSVMDMQIYLVESDTQSIENQHRSGSPILNWFEGTQLPRFHRFQKPKRPVISTSGNTPPAKRPVRNPFRSFFNDLLKEKMTLGPKTITLVQDNAKMSASTSQTLPAKQEVVHTTGKETNMDQMPHGFPTPGNSNCFPWDSPNPPSTTITTLLQGQSLNSKTTYRDRSVEKMPRDIFVKKDSLGTSDHSASWRSLDMEDFQDMENLEDVPILGKYTSMCEVSNHTGAGSRASMGTFSASSKSATMNNLMEDLGTLHDLFRERCDTGTSSEASAVAFFKILQADIGPNMDVMDLKNDPIPCNYTGMCEVSNHTGVGSRASTGTFSASSKSDNMNSLMEDLSVSDYMFRERCDTDTPSAVSAIAFFEKAQADIGLNVHARELHDDRSLASFCGGILEEGQVDITPNVDGMELDDLSLAGFSDEEIGINEDLDARRVVPMTGGEFN